jgi:primosomal protein N' (replication factor Y) (superfamily II helicase)
VLIQTEFPEHPLLTRLASGGYDEFAAAALEERRAAGWPPYARIAVLRAEAARREPAHAFLERARTCADPAATLGVEILGPAAAPMERRGGHYRAQLLARAVSHAPLQRLLASWLPAIEALPEARRVRWSIDVDPAELF